MKVTFNDAVECDFTQRLIYFSELKIQALNVANEHLRPIYGDNLSLRLFDKKTQRAIENTWVKFMSSEGAHVKERYLSRAIYKSSLLPDDYTQKTLSRIRRFPYNYNPENFEVAIWMGDTLCGLAKGGNKRDYEYNFVSVLVTEGSPDPNHPLKGHIKDIVDIAASYYASALGVERVAYFGPYSKGAKNKNEAMGLQIEAVGNGRMTDYCYVRYIKDVLKGCNCVNSITDFTVDIE